jgi:RecB family exonuclease
MADRKASPPPATTPQAREHQLVALAYDVAEGMMRSGNPPAQVVTHFLKMGSSEHEAELRKKDEEIAYLRTRNESLSRADHGNELAAAALRALGSYRGEDDADEQGY